MHPIQIYGRINGISRIGDLLRAYMFPWLAFYATDGSASNRVLFISIASLVQSVPSLFLSHYSAHYIRRMSPLGASIVANGGLGILSVLTAIMVLAGFTPQWFVLLMCLLVGLFEVVYYPGRDCLYAALASGDHGARERANRSSVAIFQVGRFAISFVMVGIVWLVGSVGEEIPRGVIAAALTVDAVTFGLVVVFLTTLQGRVNDEPVDSTASFTGTSLREALKVAGVAPILVCILMIYSFAYSSFFFCFGLYKEFVGVGEYERQISFQLVQCACAFGGFIGGRLWKVSFNNLVVSILAVCVCEAMYAFVPKDPIWGTVWLMCNSFTSFLLFTVLFDGIIPQAVQGLERNAEVSSAIFFAKRGVASFLLIAVAGLASYRDSFRDVLFGACVVTLATVVITLFTYRKSVQKVIPVST